MRHFLKPLFMILSLAVASASAVGQTLYDRDGRFVPAPNGIPSDPNQRAVPLYSGTPGGAVGEPAYRPQPFQPLPSALSPRPTDLTRLPRQDPRSVGITDRACIEGWSKRSGLSRKVFAARCQRLGY